MDRLALIVENARPRLAEMLGRRSFEIEEPHSWKCSIRTSAFSLNFYRQPESEVIETSFRLREIPLRSVKLSDELHTWLILKSRGEPWPQATTGTAAQKLSDELDRVSRALRIVTDKQTLVEALVWEAGYRSGWLEWG